MDDPFKDFAFQIGDLVQFKGEQALSDRFMANRRTTWSASRPFPVVERILQECHGGRQRLYALRLFRDDGVDTRLAHFAEVELVKWDPPPVREEPAS